jgi:hypothetical protein
MQHYHHLFFNNFDGVLELVYPRFCAEVGQASWRELTRLFFQTVPQHSPYLSDVPARFAEFIDAQTAWSLSEGQIELSAFELACFELKIADDEPRSTDLPEQPTPQGDAFNPSWVVNPDTILFESLYPVHDLSWDPRSTIQTPTFLVLVRDPIGLVQTHAVSAASARLLHLIHTYTRQPLAVVIDALAQELNQAATKLLPLAQQQITQWLEEHVLLAAGMAR